MHEKDLYRVMRDVAEMVCHGKKQAWWQLRMRTGRGRWRWFKMLAHNSCRYLGCAKNDRFWNPIWAYNRRF